MAGQFGIQAGNPRQTAAGFLFVSAQIEVSTTAAHPRLHRDATPLSTEENNPFWLCNTTYRFNSLASRYCEQWSVMYAFLSSASVNCACSARSRMAMSSSRWRQRDFENCQPQHPREMTPKQRLSRGRTAAPCFRKKSNFVCSYNLTPCACLIGR